METGVVYTWTFSVIAMISAGEDEHESFVQSDAYNEFENAITTIGQPSKDINFVIYLYNLADKKCCIKQTRLIGGRYCLEVVESYSLPDFYGNNYQHLVSFVHTYSAIKRPLLSNEEHTHFLITWGHACGVGFFSNGVNARHAEAVAQANTETLKCITAASFKDIIEKGFKEDASFIKKGSKIDYLLCVSCFTQMIETGYILSKVINVMVAPVTTISFYGYNYKSLFKIITEKPSVDALLIANDLVDNYLAKYAEPAIAKYIKNGRVHGIEYRKQVAFSAINLKQYGAVKEGIKLFVDFVTKGGSTINLLDQFTVPLKQAVKHARGRCLETTFPQVIGTGIIDFNNFIMQFFKLYSSEFITGSAVKNLFNMVYGSYYNGLIIAQYYPGHYCYFDDITERHLMSQSAGSFGIFLPRSSPSLTKKEQQIFNTLSGECQDFWAETGWLKLIEFMGVC